MKKFFKKSSKSDFGTTLGPLSLNLAKNKGFASF